MYNKSSIPKKHKKMNRKQSKEKLRTLIKKAVKVQEEMKSMFGRLSISKLCRSYSLIEDSLIIHYFMYHPNRTDKQNASKLSRYIPRDSNSVASRYRNSLKKLDEKSIKIVLNFSLIKPNLFMKLRKEANGTKVIQYFFKIDYKNNRMVTEMFVGKAIDICKSNRCWKDFDDILFDEKVEVVRKVEREKQIFGIQVEEEEDSEEETRRVERPARKFREDDTSRSAGNSESENEVILGQKRLENPGGDIDEGSPTRKKMKVQNYEIDTNNSPIGISDLVNINPKKHSSEKISKPTSEQKIKIEEPARSRAVPIHPLPKVFKEKKQTNFLDLHDIVEKLKISTGSGKEDKPTRTNAQEKRASEAKNEPEKSKKQSLGVFAKKDKDVLKKDFDRKTFNMLNDKLRGWVNGNSKHVKEDNTSQMEGVSKEGSPVIVNIRR